MNIYTIIIGFIIGSLLSVILKYQKPIYHGQDSNIIKHNIYYDINSNSCYKLIPKLCSDSLK